jgi:YHS domain-containing protein
MRVLSSLFLALCVAVLMGCSGEQSQSGDTAAGDAGMQEQDATEAQDTVQDTGGTAEQLVDLANATCPVCGMDIHGDEHAVYEGQIIHTCTAADAEAFMSDPEKYMAVLKEGKAAEGEMSDE